MFPVIRLRLVRIPLIFHLDCMYVSTLCQVENKSNYLLNKINGKLIVNIVVKPLSDAGVSEK
jgi:hypothetical protein